MLGALARASAQADPRSVLALEKQLPSMASTAGLDVDSLERAAVGA